MKSSVKAKFLVCGKLLGGLGELLAKEDFWEKSKEKTTLFDVREKYLMDLFQTPTAERDVLVPNTIYNLQHLQDLSPLQKRQFLSQKLGPSQFSIVKTDYDLMATLLESLRDSSLSCQQPQDLRLPFELWIYITKYLKHSDLLTFCLVCRQFNSIALTTIAQNFIDHNDSDIDFEKYHPPENMKNILCLKRNDDQTIHLISPKLLTIVDPSPIAQLTPALKMTSKEEMDVTQRITAPKNGAQAFVDDCRWIQTAYSQARWKRKKDCIYVHSSDRPDLIQFFRVTSSSLASGRFVYVAKLVTDVVVSEFIAAFFPFYEADLTLEIALAQMDDVILYSKIDEIIQSTFKGHEALPNFFDSAAASDPRYMIYFKALLICFRNWDCKFKIALERLRKTAPKEKCDLLLDQYAIFKPFLGLERKI